MNNVLRERTLPTGQKIQIVQGDITTEDVTAELLGVEVITDVGAGIDVTVGSAIKVEISDGGIAD